MNRLPAINLQNLRDWPACPSAAAQLAALDCSFAVVMGRVDRNDKPAPLGHWLVATEREVPLSLQSQFFDARAMVRSFMIQGKRGGKPR